MDFDARALRPAADAAGVPVEEIVDVVAAALKDAYDKSPAAQAGVEVLVDVHSGTITLRDVNGNVVTPPGFGPRATTAARQAIVSWARNRERLSKVGKWATLEGQPINATVRSVSRDGEVRLDAQGTAAVLPAGEGIAGEVLSLGDDVTVLLLAANVTDRGSVRLTVSRRQPALVSTLFGRQLDRIMSAASVVGVAREPGVRAKVACAGPMSDPRSELIGPSGTVVRQVMAELGGEKIDVVQHDSDLARYVAAALSPAVVVRASVTDPLRRVVRVEVSAAQRPIAEGVNGVNLRLATRLTGARVELAIV